MAHSFIFTEEFDFAEELKDVDDQVFPDDENNVQKLHDEEEEREMEKDEGKGAQIESSSSSFEKTDCNIDIDTADLGISDIETQPLVPTLEELAYSDYIHNRQLASKKILEFLHEAETKEELQSILEIMCKLSDDEEVMVRSELMEHIPSIALFCKQHVNDLGVVIRQQLVPYTVKLLSDNQIQVRKVGHSSLVVLLENNLIDYAQLSEWICPLIAQLAVLENNAEDLKAEDVSVMCKMIPLVGKEIVQKFFLEPFISLCCDSALTIRKICASSCGTLSKVIGTEQTESTLLPAFYKLCDDEIWSVRKACADVIVDIATVVTPKKRKHDLSIFYLFMLNDNSPKVRNAAYQSLGGFIATFACLSETNIEYENGKWIKTDKSESCDLDLYNANIEGSKEFQYDEECESDCKDNILSDNVYANYETAVVNNSELDTSCLNKNSGINKFNIASDCHSEFRTRGYSQDFERPKKNLGAVGKSEIPSNIVDGSTTQSITDSLSEVSDALQGKFICNTEQSLEVLPHQRSTAVTEINSLSEVSNQAQNNILTEQKNSIPSVSLQTKDGRMYFHIDNENLFNDFQFWKMPFPEVELGIDFEEGNAAQIHVRAKVHHEESSKLCATELKVLINPDVATTSEASSIFESKLPKLQVQTSASITDGVNGNRNLCNSKERIIIPSVVFESDETVKRANVLSENRTVIKSAWKNNKILDSPYHQDIVPPEILGKFINLHFEDFSEHTDDERTLHCAFNFPAVAYTLGRRYWPVLKRLCYILAHDVKWIVRRTVASSLHELAAILGHDIVVEDLLPIFFSLLKDIDEVRLKVVVHLPEFLKHLEPQERRQFLPAFEEFLKVDNDRNWRFRYTVAEQLIPAVEMFDPSDIYDYFLPVASSLIEDKVSDVRKAAVELIAMIIKSLSQGDGTAKYPRQLLAEYDAKYRQAHKWLMRQTYVLLCEQLAVKKSLTTESFVDDVIPNLFSLAWDSVPNVRLAVSRCIAQTLLPLDYLPSIQKSHYQLLLQVMYSLQSDVDKDVRYFAYLSAASFNVVPQKKLSPV